VPNRIKLILLSKISAMAGAVQIVDSLGGGGLGFWKEGVEMQRIY
jgi:hypothetical protein